MSSRIVIIGGGYLGTELAKSLEQEAEVTLIERAPYFVHAPAMIRAVTDPAILERAFIPYDKLLTRGSFVQGTASAIDAQGVTLEDGSRVDGDYVVVATGSRNSLPFKPVDGDVEALREANARVHAQLASAKTVAIVGAGAVGIELAGEIAHAMPDKSIFLVCNTDRLMPDKPATFGRSLKQKLEAAGVEIIFGAKAENLERTDEPYAGVLNLSSGRELSADLIFPVVGSHANTSLLETLPDIRKSRSGRFATDGWMRPSSLPNVFAAGDVVDNGDAMTIVAITRQVPWLAKTLRALMSGKAIENIKPYAPWGRAPILLPLGPVIGSSFLVLFTAGNWVTSKIKGADMFLTKYRKNLGAASNARAKS